MLLMQPINVVTVNCDITKAMPACQLLDLVVSNTTADSPRAYEIHTGASLSRLDDLLSGLKQSTFAKSRDSLKLQI